MKKTIITDDYNPGFRLYLGSFIIFLSFFMVPTGLFITHHYAS